NKKRQFTAEFKKEAVALVTEQNYTVARAASSLGISSKTLHTWVTRERNLSEGALCDDERAELKRLRKENKELKIEKEILKKASAFFAKHMS
ncbi:TPA: transposase, partial [Salmonella enterica subsp. enterica serovar Paratyphi B]|nr:transposase [Salmonella enterica subsp. enterica serovar Paratyphi B]